MEGFDDDIDDAKRRLSDRFFTADSTAQWKTEDQDIGWQLEAETQSESEEQLSQDDELSGKSGRGALRLEVVGEKEGKGASSESTQRRRGSGSSAQEGGWSGGEGEVGDDDAGGASARLAQGSARWGVSCHGTDLLSSPHVLPEGLLAWIQSQREWVELNENERRRGTTGKGGDVESFMLLDKAGMAAEEEMSLTEAQVFPQTFDKAHVQHLLLQAPRMQLFSLLRQLLNGEPSRWLPQQRAWAIAALVATMHQQAYTPSKNEQVRRRALECPHPACEIEGCGGDAEPFWLFPRDRWRTLQVRPLRRRRSSMLLQPAWAAGGWQGRGQAGRDEGDTGAACREQRKEECRRRLELAAQRQAIEADAAHPEYPRMSTLLHGNTIFARALHYVTDVLKVVTLEPGMKLAAADMEERVGQAHWREALRWAQGAFVTRGLPASEDYRTRLRLRYLDAERRRIQSGQEKDMGAGSAMEDSGSDGQGPNEVVEYEQERLARIQQNKEALQRVGLCSQDDPSPELLGALEGDEGGARQERHSQAPAGSDLVANAEVEFQDGRAGEDEGDDEPSQFSDFVLGLPPPVS